jgi:hypothetical protein
LEVGYGEWLASMLSGALTAFYKSLRWPGWQTEVTSVALDHAIVTFPPPWSRDGKDLSSVARKPIRLRELVSFHQDTARQLGLF